MEVHGIDHGSGVANQNKENGFGVSVIQRLVKTSIKKNLYYEIKDKVIEESFNGLRTVKKSARVKVYGTDSTKDVRARLIEILYDRVQLHKDKFIAPILHKELQSMETKKNGKVEHADNAHDDQVFSYLMAMRVWYDGEDLMERYSIQKSTIKTDTEEEVKDFDMQDEIDGTNVDVETMSKEIDDKTSSELEEELKYVEDAARYNLAQDFNRSEYEKDMMCLNTLLNRDKKAKQRYIEKYHFDPTEPSLGGTLDMTAGNTTELPDELFGSTDPLFDDEDLMAQAEERDHLAGNLAGQWRNLM